MTHVQQYYEHKVNVDKVIILYCSLFSMSSYLMTVGRIKNTNVLPLQLQSIIVFCIEYTTRSTVHLPIHSKGHRSNLSYLLCTSNRNLRMMIKYAVNFKFHYQIRILVPNMYVHFCRDVYDFRNVVRRTEKTVGTNH